VQRIERWPKHWNVDTKLFVSNKTASEVIQSGRATLDRQIRSATNH
jgi:hypothetical protein